MPKRLVGLAFLLLILPWTSARAGEAPERLPVQEVAAGVFVYRAPYALAQPPNGGAIGNAGFVVGRDGVAVIDTEGSYFAGRRLLAAVKAKTDRPIRYVINTHVHPDHTLGNAAFAETGAMFVGHRNLPEALGTRAEQYLAAMKALIGPDLFAGTRIVPPTVLVSDRMELDLGARKLVLEAWETAHTNSDLTVLDEATGTWFLGDLLFAGHTPALDGRLAGWLQVIERLKARPAERVVPGHGPASMPWPAALRPMEQYLLRLQSEVRAMVRRGETLGAAAEEASRSANAGDWALFEEFHPRNVTAAFHELEWE